MHDTESFAEAQSEEGREGGGEGPFMLSQPRCMLHCCVRRQVAISHAQREEAIATLYRYD